MSEKLYCEDCKWFRRDLDVPFGTRKWPSVCLPETVDTNGSSFVRIGLWLANTTHRNLETPVLQFCSHLPVRRRSKILGGKIICAS